MGIANASRRSLKVRVMPIPSMVSIKPKKLSLGVTQLNELGLKRPNRHPNATHKGNAVDTVSLTASTQSLKLLLPLVLKLFDEMPERTGATDDCGFFVVAAVGEKEFDGRAHLGFLRDGDCEME